MCNLRHIIISQDFFPIVGGAHHWLYEVYKRWPEKVLALVADYSSQSNLIERQIAFDQLNHGSLTISRQTHFFRDLNLFGLSFYITFLRFYKLLGHHCPAQDATLHCLRAYPEGFVAALYKRIHGNKLRLVTYVHGEEVVTAQTSRQLTWMAKFAYTSSDCIIANSKSTHNLVSNFCYNSNIHIIYPGVDNASFSFNEAEVTTQRQKWGVIGQNIVLISISRMEPRKNHERILKSISELRKQGIPVIGVMASGGKEKPKLQQLAYDLGISEHVRFPGYINDRERALSFAAADIHVQPSIQSGSMIEGYGIVFIEAAAAGIPSIAGNIGGQSEAVLDGETGFVIDGSDQKQLTETIKKLAASSKLRKQMGSAGRSWAKKNDWDQVLKQTVLILGA